jgi:hypothetical protein
MASCLFLFKKVQHVISVMRAINLSKLDITAAIGLLPSVSSAFIIDLYQKTQGANIC